MPLLNIIPTFFGQGNGNLRNGMMFPIDIAVVRGRSRTKPWCLTPREQELMMGFMGLGRDRGEKDGSS